MRHHGSYQQPFGGVQGTGSTPKTANGNPREVFVGYLPHACEERQLFELFDQYHHVEEARIMRSNSADHETLLYGFVRLKSPDEVRQSVKLLNNTVFGGRRIK